MQADINILQFGRHKGQALQSIPDDYLCWLGKPTYSGKFYKSLTSMEKTWRVPLMTTMAARQELDRRGFKLIGERWEK